MPYTRRKMHPKALRLFPPHRFPRYNFSHVELYSRRPRGREITGYVLAVTKGAKIGATHAETLAAAIAESGSDV